MNSQLSAFRTLMAKQKVDAVFISSVANIFYLTRYSGFSKEDRDAFLFITKNFQYIFTHEIYKHSVLKQIKNFELIDIKRENPISKSLSTLIKKHKIKKLGFEAFDLKVSEYQNILKLVDKKILKPLDIAGKQRAVKTKDEIQSIKKACQLGDKTYSYILKYLRVNITEKKLAYHIDSFIRVNYAEPSFPTIVAFGSNAAHPHHVPTNKKLTKNNFVLIDFGVKFENYCSDMTRTVFFGKANKEQKHVYETVLESQNKAVKILNSQLSTLNLKSKPIKTSTIDNAARQHIIGSGFPTIPHSLGHGIGLDVHESPRLSHHSKDVLKENMVFSIEPGIYIPKKMGVRIEDLFAIVDNKLIQLTRSPNEFKEI